MPADLATFRYPAAWSATLAWALSPLGLSSTGLTPGKVDTSGVSYAAWVSVADVSASKSLGARKLHQECRLRVL